MVIKGLIWRLVARRRGETGRGGASPDFTAAFGLIDFTLEKAIGREAGPGGGGVEPKDSTVGERSP